MRIIGGILLLLWGMYVAASLILRTRISDLADAGKLGEALFSFTCSTVLLGGGIILFLPRRKRDDAPSTAPARSVQSARQAEGSSSGDAVDTKIKPSAEQIRKPSE